MDVQIDETIRGLLTIPSLDFVGLYVRSPNGRFRIAWRDGDGNRGGARDSGEGHYVLIDGERVACKGRMQRPNDGKVADNGVFILNDWRFSHELSGTFWAFRPDGSAILSQRFAANLFNNGLSRDGSLAACHTCNSNSEADSAVLAIFDLTKGEEVKRFRAECGWPNTYEFSPGGRTVVLGYANGGGEFTYGTDGAFIGRDKWIATRLKAGDLYMVRRLMDEAGGVPDQPLAEKLLAAVETGLAQQNWRDDRSQASGLRLRGEVLDAIGATEQALESFERALALNPKIGLKQRVEQIRRGLRVRT